MFRHPYKCSPDLYTRLIHYVPQRKTASTYGKPMKKIGLALSIAAVVIFATGCSQKDAADSSSSTAKTASSAGVHASGPTKPAATADDNVWGTYLSEQGKMHGKDVQGHPYIYLIPAGDSPAAIERRTQELQSVAFSIGPIVIPGSLLVLGGPNAQQTNQFVLDVAKKIKEHALKNVVVLIVSDTTQKDAITKALAPTEATLRFVTM
jgi:hypothetical protein